MTAFVALLRAVNVGGTGIIKMAGLKALCEGIGFRNVKTILQSGNVVFTATGTDKAAAKKLADALEKSHGFRPAIMVRTGDEIADAMTRNPFRAEERSDPSHLLIAFMADAPASSARERIAAIKVGSKRLYLSGHELYVHYAAGVGKSKVTNVVIERALGIPCTERNWNTVTRLLQLAQELEGSGDSPRL